MHLVDVRTYKLKSFFTERLPQYAILSHTWGDEEVTFQEMTGDIGRHKAGFKKIAYACQQALKDGLDWAWVDTCCIDKTSSAELSEAINSMFQWYQASTRCYAYILDYEVEDDAVKDGTEPSAEESSRVDDDQFRSSRWFTRGWTLQELVAPKTIDFFSRSWKHFGTKATLAAQIESITNIERAFLLHNKALSEASVSKRMSWAASRETTRAEDMAYCLLGIFGINMPLLYGEGRKAFHRLQTEIWHEYDDDTLLAWTVPKDDPRCYMPTGVFASTPLDFQNSGSVTPLQQQLGEVSAMTKKGLRLNVPIFLLSIPIGSRYKNIHVFRVPLNCGVDRRAVSMVAVVNQQQGNAASYTRIATPHHHLDLSADFSRVKAVTTAFLARSAPTDLVSSYHRSFHMSKASARLYIKKPEASSVKAEFNLGYSWRFTSPNARRFRRVEMKLFKVQSDPNTNMEDLEPLMTFANDGKTDEGRYAPNVLQMLVVFNENRRDGQLRNGFELRCAVQMKKDCTAHAAFLEWKTWDDGTEASEATNLDETLGDALIKQKSYLDPQSLVQWAETHLQGLELASPSRVCKAEVDMGGDNVMSATLERGSPEGIIGGVEHFILDLSFDVRKEIG
jgi:hypothetical protein